HLAGPGHRQGAPESGHDVAGPLLASRHRRQQPPVAFAAGSRAGGHGMTAATGKAAIAVALHDGFCSFGTGAGSANRAFLTALPQLIIPAARLVILPVGLAADSTEYDPAWHAEMQALTDTAGGEVFPVDNGTGGQARFGGVAAFRQASLS